MAILDTFQGAELLLMLGDGNTDPGPEVFAHPCAFNGERSIQFTATTREDEVIDCDDPTGLAFQIIDKDVVSFQMSGQGIIGKGDVATFQTAVKSAAPVNVKIRAPSATAGQVWEMTASVHLTSFEVSAGGRKDRVRVSLTYQSTGEFSDFTEVALV